MNGIYLFASRLNKPIFACHWSILIFIYNKLLKNILSNCTDAPIIRTNNIQKQKMAFKYSVKNKWYGRIIKKMKVMSLLRDNEI